MREATKQGIEAAVRLGLPTVSPSNIPARLGGWLCEQAGEQFGISDENPDRNPAGSDLALIGLARVDNWVPGETEDKLPVCTETSYKAAFITDMGSVISLWFSSSELVQALESRGAEPASAASWGPMPVDRVREIYDGDAGNETTDLLDIIRRLRGPGDGRDH